MACRVLGFEKGGIYHLYNRSTEMIPIFRCAADYHYFISRMLFFSEKMKILLPPWSLLPTHYHMAAEQGGDVSISYFVMLLCNSYGKHFNFKYNRSGRLFGQSFKAKRIEDPSYLERVTVYIENNAVHHGLVDNMNDWQYSSLHWPNEQRNPAILKNDVDEFEVIDQLL